MGKKSKKPRVYDLKGKKRDLSSKGRGRALFAMTSIRETPS